MWFLCVMLFENFTSGRVNDVEGFEKKEDTSISLLEKAENLIYNEDEKLREIFICQLQPYNGLPLVSDE